MENTLTIYIASLHEHWNLPDNLALKWEVYEKGHPIKNSICTKIETNDTRTVNLQIKTGKDANPKTSRLK